MVSGAKLDLLCEIKSVPPENTRSTGTLVPITNYWLIIIKIKK